MNKKYSLILLALLCVSFVSALGSYENDYRKLYSSVLLVNCNQAVFHQSSRSITLKLRTEINAESFTKRDCLDGVPTSFPLERNIWIKDDVVSYSDLDIALAPKGMSNNLGMLWSNEPDYKRIFVTKLSGDIKSPQSQVYINGQYLDEIREYDYGSRFSTIARSVDNFPYIYALASEDLERSLRFVDNTNFDDKFWGAADKFSSSTLEVLNLLDHDYDTNDLSDSDSVLYGDAIAGYNTFSDSLNDYYSMESYRLTSGIKTKQQASIFAFTDDINYYYYPVNVLNTDVIITGYNSAGQQVYSKAERFNPTSNEIRIDLFQLNFFNGGARQMNIIDVPDVGTKLLQTKKISGIPSDVERVDVYFYTNLQPSPLYRHKSPIDSLLSWRYLFGYSTSGACETYLTALSFDASTRSNLCGDDPYGLQLFSTKSYNFTSETGDSQSPNINDGDIDDPLTNTTGQTGSYQSQVPDLGSSNLTGNNSGIDWSVDSTSSGGFESQLIYLTAKEQEETKETFFFSLREIIMFVLQMILLLYTMSLMIVTFYAFILMMPSAYMKMSNEFDKLINKRWR